MKHLLRRYSLPIPQNRPKGARLLEGYSPKLGRRVQLFDYASFSVWIGLEVDPTVNTFCERPARFDSPGKDTVIDFWVQRVNGDERFCVISNDDAGDLPITLHETTVHYVHDGELAASNMWVTNWQRMLAVINASGTADDKVLMKSVRDFVQTPIALGRLEAQFACGDPVPVRAGIFELMRKGHLSAPSLRTQLLSLFTSIEPAP